LDTIRSGRMYPQFCRVFERKLPIQC